MNKRRQHKLTHAIGSPLTIRYEEPDFTTKHHHRWGIGLYTDLNKRPQRRSKTTR